MWTKIHGADENLKLKYKLRTDIFIYNELIDFRFTGKQLRDLSDLNFVIHGKVISSHKVNKYVKRNKSSFDDFSVKHTPCEPLRLLK